MFRRILTTFLLKVIGYNHNPYKDTILQTMTQLVGLTLVRTRFFFKLHHYTFEILKITVVAKSAICYTLKKFGQSGTTENKNSKSRPPKLSYRDTKGSFFSITITFKGFK